MTIKDKAETWVFKQSPLVIVLILLNVFQYIYFNEKMDKQNAEIKTLHDKVEECLKEKF